MVAGEHEEPDEEGPGRNGTGASDEPTVVGTGAVSPTYAGVGAEPEPGPAVRVDDRRGGRSAAAGLRRAARTVIALVAVTLRLVAWVLAAVLLIRIGLAFVPVNPDNVIVGWIVRFSDVLVWGFRDLFLPTDPRVRLVANYGLAALFWLVVGLVAAAALSALGRRLAA